MKFINIKIRGLITKMLCVLVISLVIFNGFEISFKIYSIIALCLCFSLVLNFSVNREKIYPEIALLLISNIFAFTIIKIIKRNELYIDRWNIILSVIYGGFLFYFLLFLTHKRIRQSFKESKLFPQQKYDLERIKEYIQSFDTIGINGVWGSGKSFLMEEFIKNFKSTNKYEFITIDLLSCDLDEIQFILLDKLEKILSQNGIFSKHSAQLKRMIGGVKYLESIRTFFWQDNMSYTETLKAFKEELIPFEKTIAVIFEDIDRITQKEVITKIFSISEQISCEKIKIVYQYDQENLDVLGFDRRYTEKYISYIVNLTNIDFFVVLEYLYKELKIDNSMLRIEEFKFLKLPIYFINEKLNINHMFEFHLSNICIRKIKQFLLEMQSSLQNNEEYRKNECKKTVITFYFIKHFFDSIYKKFSVMEGLLDVLKFEYQEKEYNILELLGLFENFKNTNGKKGINPSEIKKIFKLNNNLNSFVVLRLFEYNFDINETKHDFNQIHNETINNIIKRNENEKKDRLIWNLLCNGKSEYTNLENAANELIAKVLNQPANMQCEAFDIFLNNMFHHNMEKDGNETIFRIGVSPYLHLFHAFHVTKVCAIDWCRLIEFYFRNNNIKKINIELITILNYCSLEFNLVYIDVLRRFNELEVCGNMNQQKCYKTFLTKYLRSLTSLLHLDTPELSMIEYGSDTIEDITSTCEVMLKLKKKTISLNNNIPIPKINDNLSVVISFIDKNIKIINHTTNLELNEPQIRTDFNSHYIHQDEYNRLKDLPIGEDELLNEIEKSYEHEKIGIYEINELLIEKNIINNK